MFITNNLLGASEKQKTVSSDNYGQNTRHKLQFLCQIVHYGQKSISIFQGILLVVTKFLFWDEDWALGYNFIKFLYFHDMS